MEHDYQGKPIEWATIVEYFTKRGKHLTKDEIARLVEEDRRIREEEDEQKRITEEQERRRMQRLMENLEEEEDFEAYQMRIQNEEAGGSVNKSPTTKDTFGQSRSETDDHENSDEFEREDDRMGGGLLHSRSARTVDPDLRKQRLTDTDYLTSKGGDKKGRYGVTVPKPFAFDIRDKVRPKTIRERKIEQMVEEKQFEED
jgi:hypothetical protein